MIMASYKNLVSERFASDITRVVINDREVSDFNVNRIDSHTFKLNINFFSSEPLKSIRVYGERNILIYFKTTNIPIHDADDINLSIVIGVRDTGVT